jgi:hypothetical protein
MEVNHAYVGEGDGSLSHFATRLGYDFLQAKNMAWLGRHLEEVPWRGARGSKRPFATSV